MNNQNSRTRFSLMEVVLAMAVFVVFATGWYATVEASIGRQRNMERQFEALVVLDNVVERVSAWPECGLRNVEDLLQYELKQSGLPRNAVTARVATESGEAVLSLRHERVGTLASVRIPLREEKK